MLSQRSRKTFWSRVRKAGRDECWEWQGHTLKGYGRFHSPRGRIWQAHRIAWELTYGEVSPELHVLHHCDNPPCCNPRHLFLGTQTDNNADRHMKGRSAGPQGDTHPSKRLSSAIVRQLRQEPSPNYSALARQYGVTHTAIRFAILGKTWKNVG